MGKASKWFRDLLGLKKPEPSHNPAPKPPSRNRWSFTLSRKDKRSHKSQNYVVPGGYEDDEASRHAIAVAAATAAVAEAAVAAAQAAAAVVKLTGAHHVAAGGAHVTLDGARYVSREERAAVTIQSHFRAYLSRRALRALKALVKLQALVRGHIIRKHYVEKLRQMQAIARAQARTRATAKSSPSNHTINGSRSNSYVSHDQDRRRGELRPWEQGCFPADNEEAISDKILQVDTWKPKRRHIFYTSYQTRQSPLPRGDRAQYLSPLKLVLDLDENGFTTAENSPQYYSASSMGDDSRSCLSSYSDHPSYMAYTESSKAKVRSLSAPKQRPQYERSSSTNRYTLHGYGDLRSNNHKAASTLHANFTSKAYPGSGRLDRLGIPLRGDGSGFNGGYWHRY